ncbi:hypothetical protein IIC38_01840 [candidate division KSB1 bacterium]|nr:hypothetical protein [candidate division KSB1 bacterium]
MKSTKIQGATSNPGSVDIIAIRPAVEGTYISIQCRSCSNPFTSYQPTVAGVAIGEHKCPNCQEVHKVVPDDFDSALDNIIPVKSFDQIKQHIEEASTIAESWYRIEGISQFLTHCGLNLGQPAERGLLPVISQGLDKAKSNMGSKE